MTQLQQTPQSISIGRADLYQNDFDTLIYQKGRPVFFEKALQCPCKSESSNQQSNCKNCGGSGWLFINGIQTRMVIQGVSIVNDIKAWSEEARGTINISSRSFEQLTYMDRISLLDSQAIFNEVLFLKKSTSDPTKYFSFTSYVVTELLYVGLFISTGSALIKIDNSNFTLDRNKIVINTDIVENIDQSINEFSITVKYIHPPTYHVLEMKRETMESLAITGSGEKNQRLPVAAIARRSHYVLDSENLTKNRLIDNSYTSEKLCTLHPTEQQCTCSCVKDTTMIRRHDFINSFSYNAYAPINSLETTAIWHITRIEIAPNGDVIDEKVAINVAWSERETVIYN